MRAGDCTELWAYYNEFDAKKAAWLRELIKRGLITDGEVDERSIVDVRADDLRGFNQHHWFAGIGIWSHALRLAGWPDDRPVWTASCPCQPFSAAGKRKGKADERHLWPDLFRLVREFRPECVFGEQVGSKDGLAWIDDVFDGMEGEGYAVGATNTVACGFGAPHIRQRLYWLADYRSAGLEGRQSERGDAGRQRATAERDCDADGLEHATGDGRQQRRAKPGERGAGGGCGVGPVNGFWDGADWVLTRPQRVGDRPGLRPIEPGSFPLAHGAAARVGRGGHSRFPLAQGEEARVLRLKGYGDGIVAPQAAAFIRAYLEVEREAKG